MHEIGWTKEFVCMLSLPVWRIATLKWSCFLLYQISLTLILLMWAMTFFRKLHKDVGTQLNANTKLSLYWHYVSYEGEHVHCHHQPIESAPIHDSFDFHVLRSCGHGRALPFLLEVKLRSQRWEAHASVFRSVSQAVLRAVAELFLSQQFTHLRRRFSCSLDVFICHLSVSTMLWLFLLLSLSIWKGCELNVIWIKNCLK